MIVGSTVDLIDCYWDSPYLSNELLSLSMSPLYFDCTPIQLTMEMLQSFSSIQIDELLKNRKDVFELEELSLSLAQEVMLKGAEAKVDA